MLQIQIKKVWSNTTMLRFIQSDRFWQSEVLENPL
jgi:hypothetical protein